MERHMPDSAPTLQNLLDHFILADVHRDGRVPQLQATPEGYRYWRQLSDASVLICRAHDAGDPVLAGIHYCFRERWDGLDRATVDHAVNWLVAEHGLTREQALALPLAELLARLREMEAATQPRGVSAIRRRGANWEVLYYEGERGLFPVKDFRAIETVVKLVSRPHHSFHFHDRMDAKAAALLDRPESNDVTHDDTYYADMSRRLKELAIKRAEHPNDSLVQRECDDEAARIEAERRKGTGPGGRRRKLGRTRQDQAWDALTKGLRRLWDRLRAGGMPLLAAHLERTIHFDRPSIVYHPPAGTPPWDTEG
jgi:hypothetical protein